MLLLGLLLSIGLSAQQTITVSGTITDADNGEALIGANILQNDASNGTVTDFDGKYSLEVPDNATLTISYLGYETKEVKVNGQAVLNIILSEDAETLDEVVVIGYGVQKVAVSTGAITKVTAETLEDMPVTRIENALQGRTSGVRVTAASGQPGAGATIRIRGTSTTGDSNPLYVVDGVIIEGGIDYLNPGDIENLQVLKDAAAAAIYGARGGNGVILVTTKGGKKGERAVVKYSSYYGTQNPWKKLALLDATEYATLRNEASAADGGPVIYEDPQSLGAGTDWQSLVFAENAPIQNHDVSISGGSENSTYYTSFSYFDQDGIVAPNNSNYKRFTTRINSTHQLNKRLRIIQNLAYTRTESRGVSENSEWGSPLGRAINLDPTTPLFETDLDELSEARYASNWDFLVRDENDNIYGISEVIGSEILNPIAALNNGDGRGYADKVVANFAAAVDIIDGLTIKSDISTDLAFWGGEGYTPTFHLNADNFNYLSNGYSRSLNRGLTYKWENTLNYAKRFGVHDLSVLLGTSSQKNSGQGNGGSIQDIGATSLDNASLSYDNDIERQRFGGYEWENRAASYFGRVIYNYKEKYLFTGVARYDGSDKFGPNNKFGFFPGVSLGWIVSEEDFFPKNNIVNFLKIRASYGENGNDRIGQFLYLSTIGSGRFYTFGAEENLINGFSPNVLSNPDLQWETVIQRNIGINAKLLKNFELGLDFYIKKTQDMLLGVEVPAVLGNFSGPANIGDMLNTGAEVELGYNKAFGDLLLKVGTNLSYNKNEVVFLGNDKEFLNGTTVGPSGMEVTRITEGLPIGYLYGFQTDGVFQNEAEVLAHAGADGALLQPDAQPGDLIFKDLNGDGVLDQLDRGLIGDPTPKWTYGMNIDLSYKNFDLTVFGQGVQGVDVFNVTRRFDLPGANYTADILNRWTGENSTNENPRLTDIDPNGNYRESSDYYVEDASFFRIKTLQIGYNFNNDLFERIGIRGARIYVSGNNIATFSNYSGFDPEVGAGGGIDRGIYPQPRFYLIGVNASF